MNPSLPSRRALERIVAATAALLVALPACSSAPTTPVYVSAAASLSGAFSDIEVSFERAHPEYDIVLNLAGSSSLREQILEGAPVDVFASANPSTMDAVEALLVEPALSFARNRLQLAVPADNPGNVTRILDLERDDLLVGLCAPQVPCGSLARVVLAAAGVEPAIDTNEPDVRSLLTKIEAGALDVGLVYRTDVLSSSSVIGFDLPSDFDRTVEYPIGVLARTNDRTAAQGFVAFVLSSEGQAILKTYGFEAP